MRGSGVSSSRDEFNRDRNINMTSSKYELMITIKQVLECELNDIIHLFDLASYVNM